MKKLANIYNFIGEKLGKFLTTKRLSFLLTIGYVLSLIPVLWIGHYNFPSADDYSIGCQCHVAWERTHNIFPVIGAAMARAYEDWLTWMGYYTSNFLMGMPPSSFGERAYAATTWFMIGSLSLGTMYLMKAIFVKAFKADKHAVHCVTMILLFISVQCMPAVGRVEAFYWYSGAANYIFVHGLELFYFGLLISIVFDSGKKRTVDMILATFLGFVVGGGNQMSALNGQIILLVVLGFLLYRKCFGKYKILALPMGIYTLGFILNCAAPGNLVRAADSIGMNPLKAVLVSFYDCLDRCISEWTTWPVIILMIFLAPIIWKLVQEIKFDFSYPFIAVFFGYCLTSAMMTPPIFAVGNMEAGRLQALTFLMYVLLLILSEIYVIGWIQKRVNDVPMKENQTYGKAVAWMMLLSMVFLLFGSVLTLIPEKHYYTFSSALVDLRNGSAKQYCNELSDRIPLYRNAKEGDLVEVQALTVEPTLLYFSDVKDNPEDWENRAIGRYYGVDFRVVKKAK